MQKAPSSGFAVDQGLYGDTELDSVPELAKNLSRGCGNPTGFADLQPGETVVDFGCGGGIDAILAARKVGTQGKVIGIDFSEEMIEQAKKASETAGLEDGGIEFRVGDMENSELPDDCADVVISNCVINLCPNKEAVYKEAFRILKPGGRLAISDVVLTAAIDPALRDRFQATWSGCLGGAVPEEEYWQTVGKAGFDAVRIVAHRVLSPEELDAMARCPGKEFTPAPEKGDLALVLGKVKSIKFSAVK